MSLCAPVVRARRPYNNALSPLQARTSTGVASRPMCARCRLRRTRPSRPTSASCALRRSTATCRAPWRWARKASRGLNSCFGVHGPSSDERVAAGEGCGTVHSEIGMGGGLGGRSGAASAHAMNRPHKAHFRDAAECGLLGTRSRRAAGPQGRCARLRDTASLCGSVGGHAPRWVPSPMLCCTLRGRLFRFTLADPTPPALVHSLCRRLRCTCTRLRRLLHDTVPDMATCVLGSWQIRRRCCRVVAPPPL